MLNKKQAYVLLNKLAKWYFNNNLDKTLKNRQFSFQKESNNLRNNPRNNDKTWAKLMTSALIAFSEGLEDMVPPSNRVASYNYSVNLAGSEAFNTIAFLVSAAGTQLIKKAIVTEACPECGGKGIVPTGTLYGTGGGVRHQEFSVTPESAYNPMEGLFTQENDEEKGEDTDYIKSSTGLLNVNRSIEGEEEFTPYSQTQEIGSHEICPTCSGEELVDVKEDEDEDTTKSLFNKIMRSPQLS